MKEKGNTYMNELLCRITCCGEIDKRFGEPFIKAFSTFMPNETERVLSASYTCSLFLSAILCGFPTAKLHTFVHNTKERFQRFSFNCKMYEKIFSVIDENSLVNVALLGKEGENITCKCSKQDIFDAFDFYTNG